MEPAPRKAGPTLQDTLASLVTAWRNLSVYPEGHPARAASLKVAQQRLEAFTASSGALTLGVSKDAVAYGQRRLATPNVVGLAQALHLRGAALVRFEEGVGAAELEAFLRCLGEAKDTGERPPLAEALSAAGVRGVSVTGVDFSALALTGLDGREPSNLWEAILSALLTGKQISPDGFDATAAETYSAAGIAALFASVMGGNAGAGGALPADAPPGGGRSDAGPGSAAELLAGAVSAYVDRSEGAARDTAIHQVAELLRALPPEIRSRVLASALKLVASAEDEASHVDAVLDSVTPDEALAALRRLSTEGTTLSPHALRLVQTLAAAANMARAERTELGRLDTDTLATRLAMLFRDEDIDRYNPEDHQALVEQAAAVDLASFSYLPPEPLALGDRGNSITEMILGASLLSTLLELVERTGPGPALDGLQDRLQHMFGSSLAAGRLDDAIAIVDECRRVADDQDVAAPTRQALGEFLGRLAASEQVMGMIGSMSQQRPETAERLTLLISRMGDAAARSLLGALAGEKDQSRRRRLFDILTSLGDVIVPEAKQLLSDSRWYVVRNMVALLRAVEDRSSLPEIRRCAEASDLRIRLEAIKTLLAMDPSPPLDLLRKAIMDPDPKLAEVAVALTGQYGIAEARDPLVALLRKWDPFGVRRSLRLKALRALADLGDASVLPELQRFFRDWRIPLVALEERRSAFRLLESYPEEARLAYVERGMASRDPGIRDACRRLYRARTAAPAPVDEPAAPPEGNDTTAAVTPPEQE